MNVPYSLVLYITKNIMNHNGEILYASGKKEDSSPTLREESSY